MSAAAAAVAGGTGVITGALVAWLIWWNRRSWRRQLRDIDRAYGWDERDQP